MSVLNVLVVIWLLLTCGGLMYAVRLVRRAKAAKRWLREQGLNGYREIVASGSIHRGEVRVGIFICMVSMGIDAAAIQFFPPGSDTRNVLSAIFRLLFILMAIGFTYKSYLEDHELDLLINEAQRRTLKSSRSGDTRGEAKRDG